MTPNIHFRNILLSDNLDLEFIIRSVFTEMEIPLKGTGFEDISVSNMYSFYQHPRRCYFVALADHVILGGAGIAPLVGAGNRIGELQKMYLSPQGRGRGIGQTLMDLCTTTAQKMAFEQLYLETHPKMLRAISFYQKNGFVQQKQPMGCTGHSSCPVYMLKNLDDLSS